MLLPLFGKDGSGVYGRPRAAAAAVAVLMLLFVTAAVLVLTAWRGTRLRDRRCDGCCPPMSTIVVHVRGQLLHLLSATKGWCR